ncbi:unnamed protein product [Urochloa decumbens]|uniref:DUF4220 domain-containing protein n=1 Tax=Urochloa decumbens TaxID=240449 RepID=A0ABC9GFA0_9POAL
MGLSSAMYWWDEWKLRILVLCSLCVQFFLFFSAFVRDLYVLRRLRVMVWIAYIGGDALAIYALATLFNRQKQQTAVDGGGNALEVIWAPVLLIHLGGQITIRSISAYSLEDNELWKRYAITLVSQVTVALYIFCRWWSGEKRLLQAALASVPWPPPMCRRQVTRNPYHRDGGNYSAPAPLCLILPRESQVKRRWKMSLRWKKARHHVANEAKPSDDEAEQQKELRKDRYSVVKDICKMFLDLSPPYSVRLHCLKLLLRFDDKRTHIVLRDWIAFQYSSMYTRIRTSCTCLGLCSLCLLPCLVLASLVLFAKSAKDGYNKSDITVTYILFSATAAMDFSLHFFLLFLLLQCLTRRNKTIPQAPEVAYLWQDMVSQHNIMLFCARKKKPTTLLMKLSAACSSFLSDYINQHWYVRHEPAAQQISVLVREHAEYGWKVCILDPATYRRFNNNLRGQETLKKHHLLDLEQLGWSINLPFDECVLLWHVATNLCSFHHTNTSSQGAMVPMSRRNSELISNYMIYLLLIYPEMLMPGTRQDLFMLACMDIELMIKDEPPSSSSLDERSIAQWIVSRIMEQDHLATNSSRIISNALKLAKVLSDLSNATEKWDVIQGVWVEMLCYSASVCRGYEHAKSLSHGVEYLTNVWLLWSLMGMETLSDKLRMPDPPESDDHDEEQAPAAASGLILCV